jgi:dihydrofolate reductase
MGRVVFAMGMSLDGYVEDASGSFDFTAPDDELHRVANEQARDAAAFVFGRRMYELMEGYWRGAAAAPEELSEVAAEFAHVYVATPRVVVSDSLGDVPDGVRLVRRADAAAEVARLAREHEGPIEVGGPTLAAALFDLIDEFRMWVNPVAVGGGKPYFPAGGEQLRLRLLEQRAFASGALYLRYERVR